VGVWRLWSAGVGRERKRVRPFRAIFHIHMRIDIALSPSYTPQQVPLPSAATTISAGSSSSFAICQGGHLYAHHTLPNPYLISSVCYPRYGWGAALHKCSGGTTASVVIGEGADDGKIARPVHMLTGRALESHLAHHHPPAFSPPARLIRVGYRVRQRCVGGAGQLHPDIRYALPRFPCSVFFLARNSCPLTLGFQLSLHAAPAPAGHPSSSG
jgi:hypothetical protein